jgi:hypothetical protein
MTKKELVEKLERHLKDAFCAYQDFNFELATQKYKEAKKVYEELKKYKNVSKFYVFEWDCANQMLNHLDDYKKIKDVHYAINFFRIMG